MTLKIKLVSATFALILLFNLQNAPDVHAGAAASCFKAIKEEQLKAREQKQMNSQLFDASRSGNLDQVNFLLGKGANPNYHRIHYLTRHTYKSMSTISVAIKNGHTEVVKALMNAGGKPYTPPRYSSSKYTSNIELAVSSGKIELVELLLNTGQFPSSYIKKAALRAKKQGKIQIYETIENYLA